MKVVVVASGDLDAADVTCLDDADLVIAADGGAASLDRLGRRPDLLVGDLDSTDASVVAGLTAAGARIERHPTDKDASDTELAIEAALAAGATEIVLLGAIGGARLDHGFANLLLLADPALAGTEVRLVHRGAAARIVHAARPATIEAAVGDLVSLLPLGGDAVGVRTTGLRWALDGETLRMGRSRGLSNEIVATPVSVDLDAGALLLVVTPSRGAAP